MRNNATAKIVSARKIFIVVTSVFVLLCGIFGLMLATDIFNRGASRLLHVGGATYKLTVADSEDERRKGLSARDALPDSEGMLFIYDQPSKRCFWMKDMRFALDIIWLDERRTITHIEQGVRPETYPQTYCPDVRAMYVIELPAGAAGKRHIQPGDILAF